ncbi:possible transposase (plasmid) [Rhodococcus jostii RHA1]|uniref:Possible transposase n=1 Tax=Rhodococcus jostii (strain RHA1) TaxID=101510 RepID=Q0RWK2_RHOJR|nr:possible transposase [Rhodococcus jostii RHA1]
MIAKAAMIPDDVWTPAYDTDGRVRDGAWVAELIGMLGLSSWPAGMALIVREARPHPGAQRRFTGHEGLRLSGILTNSRRGQLPDLETAH